ncbi:hypothetical protein EJ08DRAFT_648979 [Tothia fuscella]|uniref:5'-deoxynucleotidase n=1 Tax=Tothia fuscella TaxID=1048955 RepID=A0A9P4U007_9PEZI|nr:hypothetical protein EJ08DRAFT_648979 [Tothia fuscella]
MSQNTSQINVSERELPDPSVVTTPKISNPWSLDKALAAANLGKPFENTSSPVAFFHILERLKSTKRAGWKRFGINHGESISDHSWRMALMTMFASPLNLDTNKCIKMSLVHDLAESLVGDITPVDNVPKAEKRRRETIVIEYLTGTLLGTVDNGAVGKEILAIWQEFEASITAESQFTQDMDKVELLLQAIEYEKRGGGMTNLQEFTYVVTKLHLQETKVWANEILKEREEFWRDKGSAHGQGGGVSNQMKTLQDQYYGD